MVGSNPAPWILFSPAKPQADVGFRNHPQVPSGSSYIQLPALAAQDIIECLTCRSFLFRVLASWWQKRGSQRGISSFGTIKNGIRIEYMIYIFLYDDQTGRFPKGVENVEKFLMIFLWCVWYVCSVFPIVIAFSNRSWHGELPNKASHRQAQF